MLMLGQEGVLFGTNELVGLVRVAVEKGKKIRRKTSDREEK